MSHDWRERSRDMANSDLQTARTVAASRTPTEAELGEAEVERFAELQNWFFQKLDRQQRNAFFVAAGVIPNVALADSLNAGEGFIAFRAAIAALRSTTPAVAVDDDALVEDFLHELDGWQGAYPFSAFPEPDLAKAAELLKAGGMTLDAISASNMRHVISRMAPQARAIADRLQSLQASVRVKDERIAAFEQAIDNLRAALSDQQGGRRMTESELRTLLVDMGLPLENVEHVLDAVNEYAREQASEAASDAIRDYEERL